MTMFYDDDEFSDEDFDDPEEVVADDDQDDADISRLVTIPALDIEPIAKALESLPTQSPLERSLITMTQELHQLLGDADAHLADRLADIEGAIRMHFIEFNKAPGAALLGILATMPPGEQLIQIEEIRQLLHSRSQRCEKEIAQEAEERNLETNSRGGNA